MDPHAGEGCGDDVKETICELDNLSKNITKTNKNVVK